MLRSAYRSALRASSWKRLGSPLLRPLIACGVPQQAWKFASSSTQQQAIDPSAKTLHVHHSVDVLPEYIRNVAIVAHVGKSSVSCCPPTMLSSMNDYNTCPSLLVSWQISIPVLIRSIILLYYETNTTFPTSRKNLCPQSVGAHEHVALIRATARKVNHLGKNESSRLCRVVPVSLFHVGKKIKVDGCCSGVMSRLV